MSQNAKWEAPKTDTTDGKDKAEAQANAAAADIDNTVNNWFKAGEEVEPPALSEEAKDVLKNSANRAKGNSSTDRSGAGGIKSA